MHPLIVKYQTTAGKCYAYDVGSGEILRVSDVVYQVLDDYHLLTPDEIYEKHPALSRECVRRALAELDHVQEQGLLCDHAPEITAQVESLCCCGEEPEPIRDFLRHRRRILILEVTHQCNLACEYCVFGKHYDQTRQLSGTPMTLETAKSAVANFLSHNPKMATIGFYGGEPLLEFKLIKDVVAFAERLAAQRGVDLRFNITTNGTLLSDEKIHYLVAHKFSVMVSLDGNKESHDRYRVFKNFKHPEERRGSFDIITRQMERFVELYPDYTHRGIVLTLTATLNLPEVETFVRQWKPSFPVFVANVVSPVQTYVEAVSGGHSIEVGKYHTLGCGSESCFQSHPYNDGLGDVPEFDDWSTGAATAVGERISELISRLRQSGDTVETQKVCDDSPICECLLRTDVDRIHHRTVIGGARRKRAVSRLSCFPGAVRTYCSLRGGVFPCERVSFSKLFEIGDAVSDVDVDKAHDFLIEMIRLGCDCGNCILNQVCTLCPARVAESLESPGHPDYVAIQSTCHQLASESTLAARLREYTEIMEGNDKVLDRLCPKTDGEEQEDWLASVAGLTRSPEQVELTVEELEAIT